MTHRVLPRIGSAFLIALMALSVGFVAAIGSQRRAQWQWVSHTESVLERIERARSSQAEVRYRERNVVLGGRASDRVAHVSALASTQQAVGDLRRLTLDNPTQGDLLDRFSLFWTPYVRESDEVVGSTGTMRARIARTMSAEHIRRFEQAGETLQGMRREEERLLAIREEALQRTYARFNGAIVGTALVMGLFLLLLSRQARKERRIRKEAGEAVAAERAALRAANVRMESLASAAFEGIAISQDGSILDANPAFVAMFGYACVDEVKGLSALAFAAPESRDTVSRKHGDCEEDPYEALLLRKDGSTFEAELRGRRIEVGGRPARVTAVRDLSDRKAAERALRESEARLSEAQRTASMGSWSCDVGTGRVAWSREMFRLFGMDTAEGEPSFERLLELHHLDDAETLAAAIEGCQQGGSPYEIDVRVVQPDGSYRWVHSLGNGEEDSSGAVVRLFGTMLDVHHRKALEAEIQSRRDELERANARLLENQTLLDERLAETAEMNIVLEAQRYQLNVANERLSALATVDGLTGLTNQRAFRERLAEECAQATQRGSDLSLLVMDVDRFKAYNDSFGHLAGDDALRKVASVLKAEARDLDVAARNGGEEFALLLPSTDAESAARIAEHVRRAVEGEAWPLRPVTVSIGLAALAPACCAPDDFLEAADRALYAAKEGGRNRVCLADGDESPVRPSALSPSSAPTFPVPENEAERLAALVATGLFGGPPEEAFDTLAEAAAMALGVPIALVSLVGEDKQWFKARVGLEIACTSREASFCSHAMLQARPMVVPDAKADPRFVDNEFVTGELGIRFYAGAPILTADGLSLGTLCAIDTVPRQPTEAQVRILERLARQVARLIEAERSLSSIGLPSRSLKRPSHEEPVTGARVSDRPVRNAA